MKHLRRIGLAMLLSLGISSTLAAQDPSVLLEKGIYTEETLGNLNDAIAIYQQVAAAVDASRATSALALFRLGMCYQKSGHTDQAQAAFAKLAKLYPEQQDLISKIPGASSQLALRPAPWVDGETLLLSIKVKSGRQAGALFYRFESAVDAGRKAWNLQSIYTGMPQYVSALIDAATFAPISTFIREGVAGREYQTRYGSQQIECVRTLGGSSTKKTFQLDRTTYDDQQLVQMLRSLPLQERFQTVTPVFSANANDALTEANIAVVAKEKVTVPAGTFDCYKTVLTQENQQPSTYWISADNHSYLVKADRRGTLDMELLSIGSVGKGEPFRFESEKLGVALTAPPGWFIDGFNLGPETMINITAAAGEASGLLDFSDLSSNGPPKSSLNEELDKLISSMQKMLPEFFVRLESRVTTTISGVPAVRYIADYKSYGGEMVQYFFYFTTPAREYEFIFETAKANFERLQPAFDSIVASLKVE